MPIFYLPKIIFVIWLRCPAGNELAPPDTALKYYTLPYRLQKGHLANYVNLLPMTLRATTGLMQRSRQHN
jgi:hypothetical protein